MRLPKSEYDFFNSLNEKEFHEVSRIDFLRYHNFIEKESFKNKMKRHERFDIERRKRFEERNNCVENCINCEHHNCEK